MFSLNRVQLIGYVTQPVELRQTPSGQNVTDLNIAVPYTFTTETGQTLSGISYHEVTAWGGMANVAAQYLKPGSQVFLSARLQTDSWEDQQTGEKRSKTRMVALDLILLDPRDGQREIDASTKPLSHCLNRADIIGNLTRDPEMRTTTGGQNVLSFGVATNERWRDKNTDEVKERVEFHNVVCWGELALASATALKKGFRVHIAGRVQTRSWETQQGTKRTTTEITADSVSLLGMKNTDIAYTSETREERFAKRKEQAPQSISAPKSTEEREAPVAAGNFDIPDIKYESEVKVEDLPF